MADFDGDGVMDFVTGKRWFAHNGGDPEGMEPGVIYWFRTVRGGGPGKVTFEAHFIHDDSGVGTQVMAADVNADRQPDIVVGNKKGTFVHLQRRIATDAEGFRSLFDGTSLAGWEGDAKFWRVEGGSLVGESTAQNPCTRNTFLLWRGGPIADFELRLRFRITGSPDANSGVQFRAQDLGGFDVAGYQADIDLAGRYSGTLHDEHGRGTLGPWGVEATYDRAGKRTTTRFAEEAAIARAGKPGEWNDYTILATGERISLTLNGVTTTRVIDRTRIEREPSGKPLANQPEHQRELHGHLALQLHSGGPARVEFQQIRLREAVAPASKN
jgi:hypothetical protein